MTKIETPLFDKLLASPHPLSDLYGVCGFDTIGFIEELRVIKAERDGLRNEVARYINALQTVEGVPAQPRRLREVKIEDRYYRWNGGVLEYTDRPQFGWFRVESIPAKHLDTFLDLIADPDEPAPVETLEDVLREFADDSILPIVCEKIRAWIKQQSVTLSADTENSYPSKELMQETGEIIRAEFQKDVLRPLTVPYEVLDGWWNVYRRAAYRYGNKKVAESAGDSLASHTAVRLAVVPDDAKPLTVEDHVAALVTMGATKGVATRDGEISRKAWFKSGDTIVIVPTAEEDDE